MQSVSSNKSNHSQQSAGIEQNNGKHEAEALKAEQT